MKPRLQVRVKLATGDYRPATNANTSHTLSTASSALSSQEHTAPPDSRTLRSGSCAGCGRVRGRSHSPGSPEADEEPGVEAEGVLGAAAAPTAFGLAVAYPGGDESGDSAPVFDSGAQDLRGVTAVMGFVEFPDPGGVAKRR